MKDYHIQTYEDACNVLNEIGLLPLAVIVPEYPALNTITEEESWHSGTEFDPWAWRTKFAAEGVAAYGKFIKKKNVLISREILPLIQVVLGKKQSIEERFKNGNVSRDAILLYRLVKEEEGIDTRALRVKADMQDKNKKKDFDNGLLELQSSMDIVISGIKEKRDLNGEKSGWSSTSFETMDHWMMKNNIKPLAISRDEARTELINHLSNISSKETVKKFEKLFA
jgi:hypothetical protein